MFLMYRLTAFRLLIIKINTNLAMMFYYDFKIKIQYNIYFKFLLYITKIQYLKSYFFRMIILLIIHNLNL